MSQTFESFGMEGVKLGLVDNGHFLRSVWGLQNGDPIRYRFGTRDICNIEIISLTAYPLLKCEME